MENMTIGKIIPGSVAKIGNREYIVLGHGTDTTAVITKNFATKMLFGATAEYATSDVREFLNGEFLNELAAAVGMDNIVEHTVNLMADDGTGKGKTCRDKVSILTTENYRSYREFLKAYGQWWWTATRASYIDDYDRSVCYVGSDGILFLVGCDCCGGVRPYVVLKSSTEVTKVI